MQLLHSIFLALVGVFFVPHTTWAQITVIGIEPDPLGGVEGGSVLIYCSARNTNNGQFISPAKLDLLRNGVDLITMRLTVQSTNSTHRAFQLANLQLSDHGAEITCALSELRSEPVTMQIFFIPSINDFSGTVITIIEGASEMHAVTVDSRPTATLTVVSTQGPVPSSITTSGYNIVLTNIARSHSGMYTLRATNTYGSDSEMFTVDVQFPPVFTTPVSNEFTCEDVTIHWQCLVGLGDSGSLSCAVMSNPTMATISVNTSDISDQNNLVVGDTTITIAGFTSGHSGFYICTASNDIGVTTRVIRLLLQEDLGPPEAVQNLAAVVSESGSVVVTWTHNEDGSDNAASSFSVTVSSAGSAPVIIQTISAGTAPYQFTVPASSVQMGRTYTFAIMASNLGGMSGTRTVMFEIPRDMTQPPMMPSGTSDVSVTDNSNQTRGNSSEAAISSFISIVLLLTCSLMLVS